MTTYRGQRETFEVENPGPTQPCESGPSVIFGQTRGTLPQYHKPRPHFANTGTPRKRTRYCYFLDFGSCWALYPTDEDVGGRGVRFETSRLQIFFLSTYPINLFLSYGNGGTLK